MSGISVTVYHVDTEEILASVVMAEAPAVGDLLDLPDHASEVYRVARRHWRVGDKSARYRATVAVPADHLDILAEPAFGMFRP